MIKNRGIFFYILFAFAALQSSALAEVTTGTFGYISYRLFKPKGPILGTLVVLHGCKQDAERIETVSGMDAEAAKNHFQVLYPNQNLALNSDHCWNWFLPVNQTRFPQIEPFGPELGTLSLLISTFKGPKYLVGFSAGAAMSENLVACYPELFVGFAIHSGVVFEATSNILDAEQVLLTGATTSTSTMISDAKTCSGQALLAKNKRAKLSGILIHGKLDVRVYPIQFNQSKAFLTGYLNFLNNSHLQTFFVDGLAHEWSGGAAGYPNSNPNTMSATKLIVADFTKNL